MSDYDFKKTDDQVNTLKVELNQAEYQNRDLESRIDIFKKQEYELE